MGEPISAFTNMGATVPAAGDDLVVVDISDTTQALSGTTKRWEWLDFLRELFATRFGADAGANDTYVVTLVPTPAAYITGGHYRFKANTANTGACTVNFNSLGAKTIKKHHDQDLADGDIESGQWVDLVYDGTNMQMQSMLGNAPSAGPATQIDETSGPTTLDINAIADGEFLKRVGTTIVSAVPSGTGAETGANSDITSMDGLTGALETVTRVDFTEGAAPSTPAAGEVSLYAKTDGLLYSKDDAGTETLVSGGAGGGAGYAGVTAGGTGSLDFAQGTKTADEPFIDGTVTWNSSGVTFVALRLAITNTASAAASKLIDLLVGGATVFNVDPSGSIGIADTSLSLYNTGDTDTGINLAGGDVISFNNAGFLRYEFSGALLRLLGTNHELRLPNGGFFKWNNSTRLLDAGNGILQIEGNSGAQGVGLLLGVSNTTQGARITRNGVRLESKLGDDSAYTQFTCEKLGVNNSAAATTLGSVTKKTEIFNAAGASLGFVAIYDAIT